MSIRLALSIGLVAVTTCAPPVGGRRDIASPATPRPTLEDATVFGSARVLDGDTIELAGNRVRLEGIDAPEGSQSCLDENGADYPCGQVSTKALTDLVEGQQVACAAADKDRYGRLIGTCFVGRLDINAWQVDQGNAIAYRKYSMAYVQNEADAKQKKLGMWRGSFEEPWLWRKKNK